LVIKPVRILDDELRGCPHLVQSSLEGLGLPRCSSVLSWAKGGLSLSLIELVQWCPSMRKAPVLMIRQNVRIPAVDGLKWEDPVGLLLTVIF